MRVIKSGEQWFLLENDGQYFLNCLCNHSFAYYDYSIQLNGDEINELEAIGDLYLDKLSYEIHYSAPGVIGSKSKFISRKVDPHIRDLIELAITERPFPDPS
jgi:hypothetical protein